MIAFTLLLMIGCFAAAVYSKKYYVWCSAVFLLGLMCMVFANTLYMQILTNVRFNSGSPEQLIIKLANIFSLSISNIKIISLVGEVIIFIFFTLILTNQTKRKALFYVISAVCICFYVWSGLPDVMFGFYLKLNSGVETTVRSAEFMLMCIRIIRCMMLIYFMLAPYIICIYKYIKTSFIIIKRSMLNVMLYTGASVIILMLCMGFNYINSFTESVPSIFYKENLPETYFIKGYTLALFLMIFLYVCVILLRGKMGTVYYMKANIQGIYGKNKVDKNIKMILHSYKNMFFAIRQLSDDSMYGDDLSKSSQ